VGFALHFGDQSLSIIYRASPWYELEENSSGYLDFASARTLRISVATSAGLSVGITWPLMVSTVIEVGLALATQGWSHCLRKSRRRS